jgi:hypothetical protein
MSEIKFGPKIAWAVISSKKCPAIIPYGNGSQFQYPIFPTRADALDWVNKDCGNPHFVAFIARVNINELRATTVSKRSARPKAKAK